MPFVVDASVVVAWALGEVDNIAGEARVRLRGDNALVPSLWWFEVRNALVQNERRGRLTEPGTAEFLKELSRLTISLDRAPDERMILILARRHRLTVYDAAYLELALRASLPLATLDTALVRAARAESVPLTGNDVD
jgi:predicted nucleic acid-binding protein